MVSLSIHLTAHGCSLCVCGLGGGGGIHMYSYFVSELDSGLQRPQPTVFCGFAAVSHEFIKELFLLRFTVVSCTAYIAIFTFQKGNISNRHLIFFSCAPPSGSLHTTRVHAPHFGNSYFKKIFKETHRKNKRERTQQRATLLQITQY